MAQGRKRRSSQVDFDAALTAAVAVASYKSTEGMTGVSHLTVRGQVTTWPCARLLSRPGRNLRVPAPRDPGSRGNLQGHKLGGGP